ncbi:MAG: gliding motility-associated C-terminal domain-containing protein [Crocinitomicaceae bacterium]|nr:gliding motility-associated C-terminal domain-containing protein [Crocinitomicaceae bacterium]
MKAFFLLTGIIWTVLVFPQAGKQGDVVVNNVNTYLNDYTYLTQDANAGDILLHVSNNGFITNNLNYPLEAGDLILIIQMQGAELLGGVNDITWGTILDYHNCGNYEFVEVLGTPNPSQITLACPVQKDYSSQGRTQVVRVPRINNLTINAGGEVTCPAWDGQIGGVVALEVLGNTIINAGGSIDVTGMGFRGGQLDNASNFGAVNFAYQQQNRGGEKGEGIGGYQNDYTGLGGRYGRGAPANGGGGGNTHNAGGGGGANAGATENWNGLGNPDNSNPNYTIAWDLEGMGFSGNLSSGGGRGGYTYSGANRDALTVAPGDPQWNGDDRRNVGGIGGRPLNYLLGKLFLGGGGGAGDGNNGSGTDGADGGGMVLLLNYGTISGAGTIYANGQNAPQTPPNGNDAPGGGGGGGTVMLNSIGAISGIAIEAKGGNGGNQVINWNEAEGPGGGGGGGYVGFSNGTLTIDVTGGPNGVTNSLGVTEFPPNGATAGGEGTAAMIAVNQSMIIVEVENDTICAGESTTLNATTNIQIPGEFYWWDAPTGGNLVYTGSSYTTPVLTQDTVYYVSHCPGLVRDTVYVIVMDAPDLQIYAQNVTCNGATDGMAWVIDMNNLPYVSYLWSTGSTNDTISNLAVGSYDVIGTNVAGCSDTATVAIAEPTQMVGDMIVLSNESCIGGSAMVTMTGGVGPYSYIWSDSSSTDSLATGLAAGYYYVQVTDANGCIVYVDANVGLDSTVTFTAMTQNILCNGDATGSIVMDPEGGNAPYTFSIGGAYQSDSSFTGLVAGNYLAIVMDSVGCTYSQQINLTEPAALSAVNTVLTPANCGQPNGEANVLMAGGVAPYQIVWAEAGVNGFNPDSLSSGDFHATITDANGCILMDTLAIPLIPDLIVNPIPVNPTCFNYADGSIALQLNGGLAPFQYNWSNGGMNTSISNLSEGMYAFTVTDSLGCVRTDSVQLVEPAEITAQTTTDSSYCNLSDGNAFISNIAGGFGPYSVEWAYNNSTNMSLLGIPAGNYPVTVTDANGCQNVFNANVSDIGVPSVQIGTTDVNCYGGNNGTATVLLNGGFPPFNYNWSGGQTVANPNNLNAGNHTITISDVNGCVLVENVQINEPDSLFTNAVLSNPLCFGSVDGSVVLSTFGGVTPYHYVWSNTGADSPSNPNLSAGNYQVTVMDQNGCTVNGDYTLTQPAPITTLPTISDVLCNGGNSGSVNVIAQGGTAPYDYTWSNGVYQSTNYGLVAGGYALNIVDDHGCIFDTTINVNEPTPLTVNLDEVNATLCYGSADGWAVVSYAGGTAPYGVNWSNGTINSDTSFNYAAGVYDVQIVDANGCTISEAFTVTQPVQLSASLGSSYPEICGQMNGSASIMVSGGTAPMNFNWSNGATTAIAQNLTTGNYQVLIQDNNGCMDTLDVNVGWVDGPAAQIQSTVDINCFGDANGIAVANTATGTAPFVFYWPSNNFYGSVNNQLIAGTHTVYITDANSCVDSINVTIHQNQQIAVPNAVLVHPVCSYSNDGSITVSAEGGIPPYHYDWSNNLPGTAQQINLHGGSYTVTVIDGLGCTYDTTMMLNSPGAVVADVQVVQNVWCYGGNTGSALASATGGTGNYTFEWNTNPVQNTALASNMTAGFYSVIARDGNQCMDTATITIFENDLITTQLDQDTTVCPNTAITLNSQTLGGSGIYQYEWMHDGQVVGTTEDLLTVIDTTGIYELVITDNLGCTGITDSVLVSTIEFGNGDINLMGTSDTLCEGADASVELTTTYGGTISVQWLPNFGPGFGAFTFPVDHDTTIMVAATNECNVTVWDTLEIYVWENPTITLDATANNACPPFNSTLSFNVDGYGYNVQSVLWTVGSQYTSDQLNYNVLIEHSGSYDVGLILTMTNGCVVAYDDTFNLTALSAPIAGFTVNPINATDQDMVYFYDHSVNATSWDWYFGYGNTSNLQNPILNFDEPDSVHVRQIVFNDIGCSDTVWLWVVIDPSFNVFIPNAFTPDGDDYNNYFYPVMTNASPNDYSFMIFNRWGELIYEGRNLDDKWDGRYQGKIVQDGVYVYKVLVRDLNEEKHDFVGHVSVLR